MANLDRLAELELVAMCPQCGTTTLDDCDVCGDWIYRLVPSDTDMGIAAAQLARDAGITRVSVLAENREGPLAPTIVFADVFSNAAGGTVLADVRFEPGAATYASEVDTAFAGDPEAIYLGTGFESALSILQEWDRRGLGGKFYLAPDLGTPEVAGLSPKLADGNAVLVTAVFDETTPAWAPFEAAYTAEWGSAPDPGFWPPGHHDQIILLALAATAAGTVEDGQAVARAVPAVANPPGTVCYTYAECVKLLEDDEEIEPQRVRQPPQPACRPVAHHRRRLHPS